MIFRNVALDNLGMYYCIKTNILRRLRELTQIIFRFPDLSGTLKVSVLKQKILRILYSLFHILFRIQTWLHDIIPTIVF